MIRKQKKRLTLIFLVLITFTCVNLVLGNEISKKISGKALWKNKKEIKLEHVLTIGNEDFEENENYFFAMIIDIKFDKNGNLYVLDLKNRRLNKYSPKGIFLKSFELKKGKGPGDYVMPQKIAVDKEDNIFIVDRSKRITILDKKGKVLNLFRISERGAPASLALGLDRSIYLTKFYSPDIDKISKYNPLNDKLLKTFCKSNKDKKMRETLHGNIAVDYDGNIFHTAVYPYEIKKFSKEGKLLNYFSREAKFQKPIKNEIVTSGMELLSISMDVAVFPDGKIINLIRHQKKQKENKMEFEYWFDIFSNDGKWLISFSGNKLKNEFIRFFNIDPFGYLYLDYMHPYPHIKKFKIEFVDKK